MRLRDLAFGSLCAAFALTAVPAFAEDDGWRGRDDHHHGEWREHGGREQAERERAEREEARRERHWREHDWHEQQQREPEWGDRRPPPIVVAPTPGYNAPPAVYYANPRY